uniref:palmitoyl-protein hydrolase n=1 Tax=Glossina brevipalpis TaxID=37001 RepID=A0A1A9WTX2_9MUSC
MKMRHFSMFANTSGLKPSATVIFFHGIGHSGAATMKWIHDLLGRDLKFPHIQIMYPTAPLQSFTPLKGELSTVWFDIEKLAIDSKENRKSITNAYDHVNKMIKNEMMQGIPINRILVGGFSMGGTLALHAAYHLNPNLGGVFVFSSFLNYDSIVYESLRKMTGTTLPELRMFHGSKDEIVPIKWGRDSFDKLQTFGVKGTFKIMPNKKHVLSKIGLEDLEEWISKKLVPLT